MDHHFFSISNLESFDELLRRSNERPVIIFKHSIACPISAAAYREMARIEDVALVEVQYARELSREIERRTGILHESPQVLVIRHGKVVWEATHWQVKASQVAEAVHDNA
jgi:bacillithiol system protein YtxJ